MQKPKFVNNEVYHIYNRGVEKRNVFLKDQDYLRFIHDLFEFTDKNNAPPPNIRFATRQPSKLNSELLAQCFEVQPQNIGRKPRNILVEIVAFCLMPNHFHLLLRQKVNGGIVRFMQKLGTGYTMYFNQKNERVGSLFQGRFKAVLINNERHLEYLPYYIHLNPLDLFMPEWREKKLRDPKKAFEFLENYRWSSLQDYLGNKNFPSVTQRSFLLNLFGGTKKYQTSITNWLNDIGLEYIQELILE